MNRFEKWNDLFSVFALFPIPVQIFSPDGLSLFVNREFLNFFNIDDADLIIGKLNVLTDPYISWKFEPDYLRRVFAGDILSFQEVRVPSEEIARRYETEDDKLNALYQDILNFPIRGEDGAIVCIVAVFVLKQVYQSCVDAMKAKTYIEAHLLDDFDQNQISHAVGLSPDHLTRLFKRLFGQTPYSYYQECKFEKIKEVLRDTTLSIHEVFAACGTDYNGPFGAAFKHRFGMTPSEYRKTTSDVPFKKQPMAEAKGAYPCIETERQLFGIAELFPIPVQIYKPNGDLVFINEAVLSTWNIQDRSKLIDVYNLKNDSLVNDQLGLHEYLLRALRGEVVLAKNIKVPLKIMEGRYHARSSDYDTQALYTDILHFTVWVKELSAVYVLCVFLISRVYKGRSDVTKAKEYLENNWREDFDAGRLATAIGLSPSHLARLFKKQTGITLYHYYQEIKVEHLKSALRNRNLSVAEAFLSCGFPRAESFSRFFKEKVGMTPSEYRKSIN